MNLKSIEYFLVVAEELNVTRAAERLVISQQALSGHIKRLEDEYNVELFYRKPVFRLTPAGRQMVFFGKQILQSESSLRASLSDITENARATLRLGISRLRSDAFFPPILKRFSPGHPNISIELFDGNSQRLEELLQSGKIDLYIGLDAPEAPNQRRIRLAEERLQCCFTEGLLRRYFPGDWQEVLASFADGADLLKLMHLPLISLRQGNKLRTNLDQFLSHYTSPNYVLECEQQSLIYRFAREGMGVGLVSPVALYAHADDAPQDGKDGKEPFYSFPVRNDLPPYVTWLVYRSDAAVPRFLEDFIRDTQAVFRLYANSVTRDYTAR